MEGEKEKVRDGTDASGEQPAATPREEQNPVGQDSAKNEYGEIGGEVDQPASYGGAGRQSDTEGEGFILQRDRGVPEEEDEASSEGGVG
jgi:hypothetical protein